MRAFDKPYEQDYVPPKLEFEVKPDYSAVGLIRFGGHLPKGGYDVPIDG